MLLESKCWFQACGEQHGGWHLDVVSLLAVIGESIIADQAQVITSTWACLLPRLVPAPQAFLRAERPRRLPPVPGVVVKNITGGSQVEELNYFANVIHEVDKLKQFELKVYTIDMQPEYSDKSSLVVSAVLFSSVHLLSFFSFMVTLALFIAACILHDGTAALGIAVLALQSSLACAAWLWTPQLAQRSDNAEIIPANIAIRTRGGAFIIIRCAEDVARSLYMGEEIADYLLAPRSSGAKMMSGAATGLFMFGVVLIGNARWTMQVALAGSFVALNFGYWCTASRRRTHSWNMSEIYHVVEHHTEHCIESSYTRCLFAVIRASDSAQWLKDTNAVPNTPFWTKWLEEAYQNRHDVKFDAVAEMRKLVTAQISALQRRQSIARS